MISNLNKIKKSFNLSLNRGLTLIELMVVIGIFMIISGVVLFNYGNFSSSVSLQNLTENIALSIRKAQSFAIGARGIDTGTDRDFTKSYGMHFSVNESPIGTLSGSSRSFLMFSIPANTPDLNKRYIDTSTESSVCSTGNDCVEIFTINTIDKIDAINAKIGITDLPTSANSSIDIIFTRPDPRAYLCYRNNLGDACTLNVSSVDIKVSNGRSEGDATRKTKIISVQNTGQISIQ